MQDRSSTLPRPCDPDRLAKLMVDIVSSDTTDPLLLEDGKNAAAVLLGRRGGIKGGRARAEKLTAEQRVHIASQAAKARWSNRSE